MVLPCDAKLRVKYLALLDFRAPYSVTMKNLFHHFIYFLYFQYFSAIFTVSLETIYKLTWLIPSPIKNTLWWNWSKCFWISSPSILSLLDGGVISSPDSFSPFGNGILGGFSFWSAIRRIHNKTQCTTFLGFTSFFYYLELVWYIHLYGYTSNNQTTKLSHHCTIYQTIRLQTGLRSGW